MFEQGRLAIMLGYSYHLPTLKAEAPKLTSDCQIAADL
jgi:hypothetical protein